MTLAKLSHCLYRKLSHRKLFSLTLGIAFGDIIVVAQRAHLQAMKKSTGNEKNYRQ